MTPASEASILLLLAVSALIPPAYLLADPCTPANVTPGNGSFSVYVRPLSYSVNTNYNVFVNGTANFTAVQFKALDAANGSSIGQWAGGTGISNCSSGSVFVNISGQSLNEQWTSPGNGSSVQIWAYITQGNVTYILTQELKQDQSTYVNTTPTNPTSTTIAATSVYPTSATNTSTTTNQSTSLLSTLTANSTINATTSIISASTINTATTAYTTTAYTTAYTTATSKIAMSLNPGSSTLSVTTTATTTYASTANFTTSRTYIQGNISTSAPVALKLTTNLTSTCLTSARTKSTATYASGVLIAAIQSTYFLFYVIVS